MSRAVDKIKAPVAAELQVFEKKFREAMRSKVALLDHITHYIVKRKGKRMRPMFIFLSAKMCGEITESTYRGASLIELLHTATLVHDDVVDDAHERRGVFSINALWKNKIAVLVGDYLLSKGLLLSIDNDEFELLRIVSNAVKEMSEGELLQMEKARRLDIKEAIYFDIIRQKTASLIASSCGVGAESSGADKATVEKMKVFGEKIGIAFQMKDDLFDFGDSDVGKPRGIDIQEKKMTLPLIYALNNASKSERRWMINTVKRYNKDKKRVRELIFKVRESGGIQYTIDKMNQFKSEALEILHSFPPSDARNSLEGLIQYTVDRKL